MAKLTLDELVEMYPAIARDQWRQHAKGGGWVAASAHVDDSATVEGVVYGNAWVYGNARVYGNAWAINPLLIVGTRWRVCMVAADTLAIGCEIHPIKWWQNHYAEVSAQHGAADVLDEYKLYIDLAAAWWKLNGHKIKQAKKRTSKKEAKP